MKFFKDKISVPLGCVLLLCLSEYTTKISGETVAQNETATTSAFTKTPSDTTISTVPDPVLTTPSTEPTFSFLNSTSPVRESTVPSINFTTPANTSIFPFFNSTSPVRESTVPSINFTTPANTSIFPFFNSTSPVIETPFPSINSTTPANKSDFPFFNTTSSVRESTSSSIETSIPDENSTFLSTNSTAFISTSQANGSTFFTGLLNISTTSTSSTPRTSPFQFTTTDRKNCNEILRNSTGMFQSPNYPALYNNFVNCFWLIQINVGYAINLRFDDFYIEYCCDFITIYDGNTTTAPKLDFKCSVSNNTFLSNSNSLLITFTSDASVSYSGFSASYTSVVCPYYTYNENCSATCNCKESNTQFCRRNDGQCICHNGWTSTDCTEDINECLAQPCPDYSACTNLNGNYTCQCYEGLEMTSDGLCQVVALSNSPCSRNTSCSHVCAGVQVNDTTVPQCYCPKGSYLNLEDNTCTDCKNYTFGEGCKFESRCIWENTFYIDVRSGMCYCLMGWTSEDCSVDVDECEMYGTALCSPKEICINNIGNFTCQCSEGFDRMPNGFCQPQGCNVVLTNSTGVIQSPNYPERYYNLARCSWLIRMDEGYKINLRFESLETECCCDFVTIYDGNSTQAQQLGTFCTLPTDNIISSSNSLLITLTADTTFTLSGFSASYVSFECPRFTYSLNCSAMCNCVQNNTQYCRRNDGQCICHSGWIAPDCSVDINECLAQPCPDYSACINLNGSYKCQCYEGLEMTLYGQCQVPPYSNCHGNKSCSHVCATVEESNGMTSKCYCPKGSYLKQNFCTECSNFTFGEGCTFTCNCDQIHTASCDVYTGRCMCLNGWTSEDCSVDVNECNMDVQCGQNAICINTPGNYICQCRDGFERGIYGICQPTGCTSILTNRTGIIQNFVNASHCYSPDLNSFMTSWLIKSDGNFSVSLKFNTFDSDCCCSSFVIIDGNITSGTRLGDFCSLPSNKFISTKNEMLVTLATIRALGQPLLAYYTTFDCHLMYADCSLPCECVHNNTVSCNEYDGQCNCLTGWTSNDCSEDINECMTHVCPDYSECINLKGSYKCLCYDGLQMTPYGTCEVPSSSMCIERNCSHICVHKNRTSIDTCYCPYGQTLENSTSCIACPNSTFGENCRHQCDCIQGNTAWCDQMNGTCYCLKGWTSRDCSIDVDECSMYTDCGPNTTCVNTLGSYICQECPFKNVSACADLCNCVQNNTAFCNSSDGQCICHNGWTSSDCSVDINECLAHPCPINSNCTNLNGSYECLCYNGQMPTDGKCEVCSSALTESTGVFTSPNYPAAYFNLLNCSWLLQANYNFVIAIKFQTLETECGSDYVTIYDGDNTAAPVLGHYCTLPAEDIISTDRAMLVTFKSDQSITANGFTINYKYLECSPFMYGNDCNVPCDCVQNNTKHCNIKNGQCTCHSGWTASDCSVDVNECLTQVCPDYSYCLNVNGSYQCLCYDGLQMTPSGSCIVPENSTCLQNNCSHMCVQKNSSTIHNCYCPTGMQLVRDICLDCNNFTYGEQCKYDISSVRENTMYCDSRNGNCTCLPGWTSDDCSVDVDECNTKEINCGYKSICVNTPGSYSCQCIENYKMGLYGNCILKDCNFVLKNSPGVIKSPIYPNYYDSYECSWLLQASDGYFVYLKFEKLDIYCGIDYIMIYDGNSTSAPSLGHYCSFTNEKIVSSNSTMLITLTAYSRRYLLVFWANYSFYKIPKMVTATTSTVSHSSVIGVNTTTAFVSTTSRSTSIAVSAISITSTTKSSPIQSNTSLWSSIPTFRSTYSTTERWNVSAVTFTTNATTPDLNTTNITSTSAATPFTMTAIVTDSTMTPNYTTAKSDLTTTTHTTIGSATSASPTTPIIITEITTTSPSSATDMGTADELLQKELYSHGTKFGDMVISQEFDVHSPMILFSSGLPFGLKVQKFCHVSIFGAITFGEPPHAMSPNIKNAQASSQNIFAPFWSEIDPYYKDYKVYYHLYERYRHKGTYFYNIQLESILTRVTNEVREYIKLGTETFNATSALIVTWSKAKPYAWYSWACKDTNYSTTTSQYCGNEAEVNTFQVILASDGTTTYAITMYKYDAMTWEYVPNRVVFVGYLTNDKLKYYQLTYSRKTVSLGTDIGTAGRQGTYIDIVGEADNPAQKCIDFHYKYLPLVSSPEFKNDSSSLLQCPCSLERLDYYWTLVEKRRNDNIYCYAISTMYMKQVLPGNQLNKLCCYNFKQASSNNWEDEQKAKRESVYVFGSADSGNLLTENPFLENRLLSLANDLTPKKWCCQDTDHCDLYYKVRPDYGCMVDSPFKSASSFGDPHITTLDNNEYTFNGKSEYILISVDDKYMLQARTHQAETSNGTLTNATVFVAFAVNENNSSSTLQVELNLNKTGMIIYADKIDFTFDFYESTSFRKTLNNFVILREDTGGKIRLVASFTTGITLKIYVGIKSLDIIVTADKKLQGKTKGLMGNFDGDSTNDFVLPNGTVLTLNQTDTERKIFFNFGKQWEVNDHNNIFTYRVGDNSATFRDPNFVPTFIEEVPASLMEEAKRVCGAGNDACIFDFVATGDKAFAANTNITNSETNAAFQSLTNSLPVLNLAQPLNNESLWEVTANRINTITVIATDADFDNVTYGLETTHPGLSISSNGTITYTPNVTNIFVIQVYAVDSRGGHSKTFSISTSVCPDCNNHGQCDNNRIISSVDTSVLHACQCNPAYTGDFCSENFNACISTPCSVGQNCTDLTPEQQGMNQTGYICGPCPVGYELQGGKCTDINECRDNVTCPQSCVNSVGSYTCSCFNGYRINALNNKLCDDINECEENTASCSQVCENVPGSYTCKCFSGFYISSNTCVMNIANEDLCKLKNCTDLCIVQNGTAVCGCSAGYSLGTDEVTCRNVDECSLAKKPCSQICTDTPGKFVCSCYPGFKLASDKISCTACESSFYGVDCSSSCQCSGHGTCDSVRGCICDNGWSSIYCNTDINECLLRPPICKIGDICINNLGSYSCICPVGYSRNLNQTCEDIDECVSLGLNDCNTLIEDCINNYGSHTCNCKLGYARDAKGDCINIDECATGNNDCEQLCIDKPGKYNCDCRYGYQLADDRIQCKQVKDVCKEFENLNCSHGCSVDLQQNQAYCFCRDGYKLVNNELCQDINECEVASLNLCSFKSGCVNHEPGYSCSCPPGSKLDNDGRTCNNCSNTTWGVNCSTSCSCSSGASRCDNVRGCICQPGYIGTFCNIDVNQCTNGELQCKANEQCVNQPGHDYCDCKTGYTNKSSLCVDIDECSSPTLNKCQQSCINSIGSYSCVCFQGFTYNATGYACDDVDECASKTDKCASLCINTLGNYRCSCNLGYVLNRNGYTCDVTSVCVNSSICHYKCVNINGSDTCFCPKGQVLNNDSISCSDIDLCKGSSCTDLCTETTDNTSIECSCPIGKKLAPDGITCDNCSSSTWGENCATTCSCLSTTTRSCNPINGSCQCLSGWTGADCSQDINECTNDATICNSFNNTECLNTNGGYLCSCKLGYVKSLGADVCQACSDNFFGKDCSQQCDCNRFHSSCNKTNGACLCDKGWTGSTCDEDINECNNASSCNSSKNELCVNTPGNFQCTCQTGYYRQSGIADCTVCPPFYYGEFCSQPCACNSVNDISCNHVNGTCSCNSKWKGTNCSQDVDECLDNTHNCPNNSECSNLIGGYTCTCESGYFKNLTTCQACACNMSNSLKCNSSSGSCTCQPEWKGETCNEDVDECLDQTLYNCTPNSNCNNTVGGYSCDCSPGYNKNITTGKCEAISTTTVTPSTISATTSTTPATNSTGSMEYTTLTALSTDTASMSSTSDITSTVLFQDATTTALSSDTTTTASITVTTPIASTSDTTSTESIPDTTPTTSIADITLTSSITDTTSTESITDTTPTASIPDTTQTDIMNTTSITSITYTTQTESILDTTPSSSITDITSSASITNTTTTVLILDTTPMASITDTTSTVSITDITSTASVTDTTPTASISDTTPTASIPDTTQTDIMNTTSITSITYTTQTESILDTTPSSSITDITSSASITNTTTTVLILDTTPMASITDTTSTVSITDITSTASVTDTTPTASISDTTLTASTTDTTSTASFTDTTSTASITDTTSTASTSDTNSTAAITDTTPTVSILITTLTASTSDTTSTESIPDTTPTASIADITLTSSITDTTSTESITDTTPTASIPDTTQTDIMNTTSITSITYTTQTESILDTTPSSSITDITSSASITNTTTTVLILDTTPMASITDTTSTVSITDITSTASVTDTTPTASISDTTLTASTTDTTSTASFTDTTSTASITDTTSTASTSDTNSTAAITDTTPTVSILITTLTASTSDTTLTASITATTPTALTSDTTSTGSIPDTYSTASTPPITLTASTFLTESTSTPSITSTATTTTTDPNTICNFTSGIIVCDCNPGYLKNNKTGKCDVCPDGYFGSNCSSPCNCSESNSLHVCDKTNGTCFCQPGWTGLACEVDIDECKNSSICSASKNETCFNTPGNYYCDCAVGYYRDNSSVVCTEVIALALNVILDSNVTQVELNNTDIYNELKQQVEKSLIWYYSKTLFGFKKIVVLDLRKGSLIVDYNLTYDAKVDKEIVIQSIIDLLTDPNITIASLTIKANKALTPCEVRNSIQKCPDTQVCESNGTASRCIILPSSTSIPTASSTASIPTTFFTITGSTNPSMTSTTLNTTSSSTTSLTTSTKSTTSSSTTTIASTLMSTTPIDTDKLQKELYPFGLAIGDMVISQEFGVHSPIILFSSGLPLGSKVHKFCHVSINGAVTFGEPHYAWSPNIDNAVYLSQNIFAPFWSEMDPYSVHTHVYYHLYEKLRNKGTNFNSPYQDKILKRATDEVKEYLKFGTGTFNATTALIVTWSKAKPYAWYSWACKNSNYSTTTSQYCGDETEVNTFQVIFASNGTSTYAITMYQNNGMKWEYVPNRFIFLGYLFEKKLKDYKLSSSRKTVSLGSDIGTAGRQGTYIDFVGEADNPAYKCINFYYNNLQLVSSSEFQNYSNSLLQCPCSLERLDYYWTLVEKRKNDNIYCYAISTMYKRRELPGNYLNKLCCYQYKKAESNKWEDAQKAARESYFIVGTLASGHILTENPFSENKHSSLENDILPKGWCCQESEFCDLFNYVRPETKCSLSSKFVSASSYGDPHITTLDNKLFTLNGWAEFIMLFVSSKNFMLQARTDRAETSGGKITNATVFVAFAANEANESRLQVELSLNKTSMSIFADKIDYTKDFYGSTDFQQQLSNFSISREDSGSKTKLVASFTCGITLKIYVGIKSLEITVQADNKLQGKTKGLMGNFDGNPNNDFVLPNGTVLTPIQTDTERKIFFNFGKQWEVDDSNTIFTYSQGESPASYRHPDFIPLFLEEVKTERLAAAKLKCGSDNDACIFDYLATEDDEFAKNTNSTNKESNAAVASLNNRLPVLNLNHTLNNESKWEVLANKVNIIKVEAKDADEDKVTYKLLNDFNNLSVSSDGIISYRPDDENIVIILVQATDDKGGLSNLLTISTATCPDCNDHGECDKTKTLETTGTFVVYGCACYPAYTGDHCREDYNACSTKPCALGQNCTDLTPEQQGRNTTGHICGPCPLGFEVQENKCIDINECNRNHNCEQNCSNTVGAFYCSCNSGYRKNSFNSNTCEDINECEENTDDCLQVCQNLPGSYTCNCFTGYYLVNGTCEKNRTNEDHCNAKNCSQLCFVESGAARCDCFVGFTLDKDGTSCKNIDECSLVIKPCSQVCTDTPGKFVCSCYPGFKLAPDKISCTACESSFYGHDCSKSCQCSGHGTCDSVRGCICDNGWSSINCNTDIDECTMRLGNCPTGEICVNNLGGYSCDCLNGYFRNKTCQDINECEDQTAQTCTNKEECVNNVGSYVCDCKSGYTRNAATKECDDIDECYTGDHNCQQICINWPGKFNCDCKYGYKLEDDRATCRQVKDVCKDFEKLNCSHGCSVDLQQNKAYCFCRDGYRLVNNELCQDINECEVASLNLCSYKSGCVNHEPGYSCSCPPGSKLDNDGRTCNNCSETTWGVNCSRSCSCSTGASVCDGVKGCICKLGYIGIYCEVDVNQCSNGEVQCNDREQCVNRPGPDYCVCKTGYASIGFFCADIDECLDLSMKHCEQSCVNSIGHYNCDCWQGYTYNTITKTCDDINECDLKMDKCTSVCVNTIGNYRCSCKPGFVLSRDGFTCQVSSMCVNSSNCQYKCVNINGRDTCFCPKGQVLNNDSRTCSDIDLCKGSSCTDLCTETTDNTSIACSCPIGNKLAPDGITCDNCSSSTWGENCAYTCSCSPTTTRSCNPLNGSCQCLSGWVGADCSQDINECANDSTICNFYNNSECLNTNGSYLCSCKLGYGKTPGDDVCLACSDNFFGKDCSQQCNCNIFHSTCNKTNGACLCDKGWTGSTCDEDINECNNANSCNSSKNELCVNNPGSFQCTCQTGYYRQNVIADCTVCPSFYYGEFCFQSCVCNSINAISCNHVNGTCSCNSKWKGTNCSQDVDECLDNAHNCPNNSYCSNLIDGYACTCSTGYFKNNTDNLCYACPCNMSNTDYCNSISGLCTCKPTWRGQTCNEDVDECSYTNSCNALNHEICLNTPGSYNCECQGGYSRESSSTNCSKILEKKLQVTFSYDASKINLTDTATKEYQNLKVQTERTLYDQFVTIVKRIKYLTITKMRSGSLIIDFVLGSYENQEPAQIVTAVRNMLAVKNLIIANQTVTVQSLTLDNTLLKSDSTLCEIRKAVQICSDNEICVENETTAVCSSKSPSDEKLIIGLAVGIPLFCLLCLVLIIVCVCVRRQKRKRRDHKKFFEQLIENDFPWQKGTKTEGYDNKVFKSNLLNPDKKFYIPRPMLIPTQSSASSKS